ncbi:MAG TPA: hypothetical protein VGR95_19985 [Thermoanaerobaculia bacterium]|nr:hypothetical protein [Thermoanaerobaculia bacterium]
MLVAAVVYIYGIVLAGEPVHLDASEKIAFTEAQVRATSAATREGLVRLASTPDGRRMLRHFGTAEYTIVVTERDDDSEVASAPEPGIATLVAANDHSIRKTYEIVLHPLPFSLPDGATALPNQAATPADQMAAAWAAELLHIDFYSRGISLPHHQRADFQREWRALAKELGFPAMLHGDDDERAGTSTGRVIFIGGERARRRY